VPAATTRNPGTPGTSASVQGNLFTAGLGGSGGAGGLGGTGGAGGDGAAGGAGAGGTIRLKASSIAAISGAQPVFNVGSVTATTQTGVASRAGDKGRVLIGSNTDASGLSAAASLFRGTSSPNPFVPEGPSTPHLSGLLATLDASPSATGWGQLAAESYGVLAKANPATSAGQPRWVPLTAGDLLSRAVLESRETFAAGGRRPPNAMAALVRIDAATATNLLGGDFTGYDLLLYVNLSAEAIAAPQMGVGGITGQLLQGGWATESLYNASQVGGPTALSSLPAGAVYATLIPEVLGTAANGGILWDWPTPTLARQPPSSRATASRPTRFST
jgi:hypothetical protein